MVFLSTTLHAKNTPTHNTYVAYCVLIFAFKTVFKRKIFSDAHIGVTFSSGVLRKYS